ncbi:hypothetical protein DFH06DRAFT_1467837 [Mycena polygramma]|nr:hypothetical protein DFH06DRAFT_1467837 [Mycena polygramma]
MIQRLTSFLLSTCSAFTSTAPPPSRMNDIQAHLVALIAKPTYSPAFPACPGLSAYLFDNEDPDFLHCLETLGDARMAATVTRIQTTSFRHISLDIHRRAKDTLLSNWTFQFLVAKLGVDEGGVDIFAKAAGNSFEIVVEALAQLLGDDVAEAWVGDLFVPLISDLADFLEKPASKRRRTASALPPALTLKQRIGRKLKDEARKERSDVRRGRKPHRGKENQAPAAQPRRSSAFRFAA